MIQNSNKGLDWDLERRNEVTCVGEIWVPIRRWVQITNNSGFCGPPGFHCREGIDSFPRPTLSKKSKVFSTATLMEEVISQERWTVEYVKFNSNRAFLDNQASNPTKISIAFKSKSQPKIRNFQIETLNQKKVNSVGEMWVGISKNGQNWKQSFGILDLLEFRREEKNQPFSEYKYLMPL